MDLGSSGPFAAFRYNQLPPVLGRQRLLKHRHMGAHRRAAVADAPADRLAADAGSGYLRGTWARSCCYRCGEASWPTESTVCGWSLRRARSSRSRRLLTGVLAATDMIEPWHLLAISLANGVLLSFDIPCRQAIVPNLVPRQHLMNAVVLQSLLMSGSTVIGPFLFAPLVKDA